MHQQRYLRLSSTTPSRERGTIYIKPISWPSSVPPFRSRFPPSSGEWLQAVLLSRPSRVTLPAFLSFSLSLSLSLFPRTADQSDILRVPKARFFESFHAFPSHLGNTESVLFWSRLRVQIANQPPSVFAHRAIPVISGTAIAQDESRIKRYLPSIGLQIGSRLSPLLPLLYFLSLLSFMRFSIILPSLSSSPLINEPSFLYTLAKALLTTTSFSLSCSFLYYFAISALFFSDQRTEVLILGESRCSKGKIISAAGRLLGQWFQPQAESWSRSSVRRFVFTASRCCLGGEGGVDLTGLRSRVLLEGKSVLRHFELDPPPPCRFSSDGDGSGLRGHRTPPPSLRSPSHPYATQLFTPLFPLSLSLSRQFHLPLFFGDLTHRQTKKKRRNCLSAREGKVA